jgi:hypothetical protein
MRASMRMGRCWGPGAWAFAGSPWGWRAWGPWGAPDRDTRLRWLEEYQRDLEQEVADVADLIRLLRQESPTSTEQA